MQPSFIQREARSFFETFHILSYPYQILDNVFPKVMRAFWGEPRKNLPIERFPKLTLPYTEPNRKKRFARFSSSLHVGLTHLEEETLRELDLKCGAGETRCVLTQD